jgi:hypothetical protein
MLNLRDEDAEGATNYQLLIPDIGLEGRATAYTRDTVFKTLFEECGDLDDYIHIPVSTL